MSEPHIDPGLAEAATSLKYSGPVWTDRVVREQKKFVRQASLFATSLNPRVELEAVGAYLLGEPAVAGVRSWTLGEGDIRVVGPGLWGYAQARPGEYEQPAPLSKVGDKISVGLGGKDEAFLTADGCVLVIPAGSFPGSGKGFLEIIVDGIDYYVVVNGIYGLEVTTGSTAGNAEPVVVELSRETAWFVRLPIDVEPLMLETALGRRFPGAAFLCSDGWMLLRENPGDLWPDGVVHAAVADWTPPSVRHRALRSNHLRTSGEFVATYKRHNQGLKAFGLAMAEISRIPIIMEDGRINQILHVCSSVIHRLEGGYEFVLPSDVGYKVGDLVYAGEIAGNYLRVLNRSLQGEFWWQARPWSTDGIDISTLRPGFNGFRINDVSRLASSYLGTGGALRARMHLTAGTLNEEAFWDLLAKAEDRLGVETFARDVMGFTGPAQSKMVNPLEVWAGMAGNWLIVVEVNSALPMDNLQELVDFCDREKPSGSIVALMPV